MPRDSEVVRAATSGVRQLKTSSIRPDNSFDFDSTYFFVARTYSDKDFFLIMIYHEHVDDVRRGPTPHSLLGALQACW
jgi:hypothetical protein